MFHAEISVEKFEAHWNVLAMVVTFIVFQKVSGPLKFVAFLRIRGTKKRELGVKQEMQNTLEQIAETTLTETFATYPPH